ncbi:MAG: sialate O-acetylesterase [Verrucomicrobiota bacterium]|nr:sialate O-acetylesterase [Limisphaera sp.]MDW8380700.1 sialate O-acetylesterase [Verrucomicrobiota bacterium]
MKRKEVFARWLALIGWVSFSIGIRADFRTAPIFTHHMVLQQGQPVPVWGWGEEGEPITVRLGRQRVTTVVRNGRWEVRLRPLRAGGPWSLEVISPARHEVFTNVLVGEVWLCSGQSNMEWPLERSHEPEADIASATNTMIRFLDVPNVKAEAPTTRLNAQWTVCSPERARTFSAVAYYFGRALHQARGVPVGLIRSDWGGSPAEAWMSRETLEMRPRYIREILDPFPEQWRRYQESLEEWRKAREEAQREGREFTRNAPWPPWRPSELYHGMIAPLIPYGIKGVLWYQGESNVGRAEQYRTLLQDLIRNWRRDWRQGDFPFLVVQLAPFMPVKAEPGESAWAELREAQLLTMRQVPKVGMVVTTDVGDPNDIHPIWKRPVGERLALAARAIAYGERIVWSGPIYRSVRFEKGRALVSFDHVGRGLEARGGPLKGFAICGEDRKWVWAEAQIVGQTVEVWSPLVPHPVAVRYGWADCPVVNLWNKEGLPASPFRTDDFPMATAARGN